MLHHQKRRIEDSYKNAQMHLFKACRAPSIMTEVQALSGICTTINGTKSVKLSMLLENNLQLNEQLKSIKNENSQVRQSYLKTVCRVKNLLLGFEDIKTVNPQIFDLPFFMAQAQIEEELEKDLRSIQQKIIYANEQASIAEIGQDTNKLKETIQQQELMLEVDLSIF